jgi:flagellar basal-body rod protein FlgG
MSVSSGLHIAQTGLDVLSTHMAVKAQNLSAQGVTAYKRQGLLSADLPYQDLAQAGSSTSLSGTINPTGMQVGLGVRAAGIYRSFNSGDLVRTERDLDIAIQGDGFFAITMPDGSNAYTRAGVFEKDAQGNIVTVLGGYKVSPSITIPSNAEAVSITPDGQVIVTAAGQMSTVGQLQLTTFMNPAGLHAEGDNLFRATDASGTPTTGNPMSEKRGKLMQMWQEGSNVNSVEEITDLIKIQRLYEMLTKVLNAGDSMLEAANRVGR